MGGQLGRELSPAGESALTPASFLPERRVNVTMTAGTRRALVLLACLLAVAIASAGARFLPQGIDWRDTYRPAARALLSGRSPYTVDIFFAAPWTLIPLVPFALLPETTGRAALLLVGLVAFAFAARRLGARPLALTAFLLSPPVLHCLLNSNIEWIPLLGPVLPPQVGLFFVTAKPQIGIGVILFWLVEAWRNGRLREVVRVFGPTVVVTLISFALFGFWPLRFRSTISLTRAYNASLWPASIPVGLALMVPALRLREIKFSLAASPCLSPYVLLHAWVGTLVSIVSLPAETVAAVIGLWALVIIRALTGAL
jgi:hypothetical protein